MNERDALEAAESFVSESYNGVWTYELTEPRRSRTELNAWCVSVRWTDSEGDAVDGDSIVIVDDLTGVAKYLGDD